MKSGEAGGLVHHHPPALLGQPDRGGRPGGAPSDHDRVGGPHWRSFLSVPRIGQAGDRREVVGLELVVRDGQPILLLQMLDQPHQPQRVYQPLSK